MSEIKTVTKKRAPKQRLSIPAEEWQPQPHHRVFPHYTTRLRSFIVKDPFCDWTFRDFYEYRSTIRQEDGPTAEEVWQVELAALLWRQVQQDERKKARVTEELIRQFDPEASRDNNRNYRVMKIPYGYGLSGPLTL